MDMMRSVYCRHDSKKSMVAPSSPPVLLFFVSVVLCPTLPVSLDCLFLIVPSLFSNVYFEQEGN